jgi:hypothetical protein
VQGFVLARLFVVVLESHFNPEKENRTPINLYSAVSDGFDFFNGRERPLGSPRLFRGYAIDRLIRRMSPTPRGKAMRWCRLFILRSFQLRNTESTGIK